MRSGTHTYSPAGRCFHPRAEFETAAPTPTRPLRHSIRSRRRQTVAAAATVHRTIIDATLVDTPTWTFKPAPAVRTEAVPAPRSSNWIWVCPAIMLIVGAIDTACTLAALKMGLLIELNPVMAYMIEVGGALGVGLYRSGMTLVGCGVLVWALRMYRDGRMPDAHTPRVRRVVWTGQGVLIAAHLALAGWWTAWFLV